MLGLISSPPKLGGGWGWSEPRTYNCLFGLLHYKHNSTFASYFCLLLIDIKTEIIPLSHYDLNYINEIQIVNHSGIAVLFHYVPPMYPL